MYNSNCERRDNMSDLEKIKKSLCWEDAYISDEIVKQIFSLMPNIDVCFLKDWLGLEGHPSLSNNQLIETYSIHTNFYHYREKIVIQFHKFWTLLLNKDPFTLLRLDRKKFQQRLICLTAQERDIIKKLYPMDGSKPYSISQYLEETGATSSPTYKHLSNAQEKMVDKPSTNGYQKLIQRCDMEGFLSVDIMKMLFMILPRYERNVLNDCLGLENHALRRDMICKKYGISIGQYDNKLRIMFHHLNKICIKFLERDPFIFLRLHPTEFEVWLRSLSEIEQKIVRELNGLNEEGTSLTRTELARQLQCNSVTVTKKYRALLKTVPAIEEPDKRLYKQI